MKKFQLFIGIIILIELFGCNPINNNPKSTGSDSIAEFKYLQKKNQIEYEAQEIEDSLSSIKTLNRTLQMLEKIKDTADFKVESDTLDITFGKIFSIKTKHLIIKRKTSNCIFIDIYKLEGNKFIKVHQLNEWSMTYIGDTIQDVNGDNILDYLFHWYPMSGCCPRKIFDVYLQKNNGDFTEKIEFINPNFSAKEKIIRGLCYGWSAPLYKYKWNNFNVDTVEYIYFPDSTNGNTYIKKNRANENAKGITLKKLPEEYIKLGYGKYN